MFTGIVTHIGRLTAIEQRDEELEIEVASGLGLGPAHIGASVCHNGTCLTITETHGDRHRVFASAETLARTTIGGWKAGDAVNLERSLCLGDELGGHLVFGHVDGLGEIAAIDDLGDAKRIEVSLPAELAPLVAVKGSITVDGVSLTVNGLGENTVELTIVPHTLSATTLADRVVGDRVNLEADMLARYVARQLEMTRGARD